MGAPPPQPEYRYVENTERYVGVHRGRQVFIGKLDHAGNFIRDPGWDPLRLGAGASSVPPYDMINFRRPGLIHVYEYRSGRLVQGELDEQGNFVPAIGSKVIDFKDYHYGKDAPRIYNLPGRFEPKR